MKPLTAGDKENKNTDRRVGEGSRTAVQQLEKRMQSLNGTWGLGGPNMPQTADRLFSLILPICDSAAAQASQDCWEGSALFHWRTGNLLLTSYEKKKNNQGGWECLHTLGWRQISSAGMGRGWQGSGHPHLLWVPRASSQSLPGCSIPYSSFPNR